ncbi:hypothetical protein AADZ84_17075 [Colwelliaceae bacterium MEBiC 14330]
MDTKKLKLKKKQLKNLSLDSLVLPRNKITKVGGARSDEYDRPTRTKTSFIEN